MLITSLGEGIPVGERIASPEATSESSSSGELTSGEPSSRVSVLSAIALVAGGVGTVVGGLVLVSVGRRLWIRFTD